MDSPFPTPPSSPAAAIAAASESMRRDISAYPGSITYLDLIRRNKRESALLIAAMIALGVVLGAVIAGALAAYGGSAADLLPSALLGAGVALILACAGAAWSWFSGASAILTMSGARPISREEDPQLYNVVDEMRLAAGLPMPRIFIIEDSALNAFATGRDPQHAAVAVTRGLRDRLTRDQLQGVIAHEMAHIRHYDIRFAMLMATMVGLIVFACDAFLRIAFRGGMRTSGRGRGSDKGGGAAIVVVLLIALVLAILAPFLARFIQMSYSRRREYLADAGAVELTRNPQGLADALAVLADDPDPLVDAANRGTAHLFIVNPLRKMARAHQSLDTIFSSHPPIQKRIARLLALMR